MGWSSLSTGAKLLLALSLALMPFGALLVFTSVKAIQEANLALQQNVENDAVLAAQELDALVERNTLALRLAANAALKAGIANPCAEARRTLALSPTVARSFELEDKAGRPLCAEGDYGNLDRPPVTATGVTRLWVAGDRRSVLLRTGVIDGSATTRLTLDELRRGIDFGNSQIGSLAISDGRLRMAVKAMPAGAANRGTLRHSQITIANGQLTVEAAARVRSIGVAEQIVILLPVLMWVIATMLSWWLVHSLLIRPLRRLQRAVSAFDPHDGQPLELPSGLGSATEIRGLGEAFVVAVDRIEESERRMGEALEGQRKLVREVHHRVKNNLQVVASLLSIHGRSAEQAEAKDAYSAIGRRVGALSVVHRNHFAEMEENQGLALRPMLNELSQDLRGSAPDRARPLVLELDLASAATTQDVAVAVAFFITEVVEYAMLNGGKGQQIEISLNRTSELTARLTVAAAVLIDESPDDGNSERRQFERVVEGLARQLRSPLDRRMGRYSVDLPVFPERG